jgi:hypothetical protein
MASLAKLGVRALSFAGLSYMAGKEGEAVIPGVQAFDKDGVNFESFEMDGSV